jgi:hypothetical protein
MIADDKENFVSRWSRRKIEARKAEEKPPEPAARSGPAVSSANAAATQQDAPAPGVAAPGIAEGPGIRIPRLHAAGRGREPQALGLKQLFRDPHFENFERFAEYCEDYTKEEPIPLAMLKTLEHAKGLLFDEEKKEAKKEDEKHPAGKPPTVLPEPEKATEPGASARAEPAAAPPEPLDKT